MQRFLIKEASVPANMTEASAFIADGLHSHLFGAAARSSGVGIIDVEANAARAETGATGVVSAVGDAGRAIVGSTSLTGGGASSSDNDVDTAGAVLPSPINVNNAIADIALGILRQALTDEASFENVFESIAGAINGQIGSSEWRSWLQSETTLVNVLNVNRNSGASAAVVAQCLQDQFGAGAKLDFFAFRDYFKGTDAAYDLTHDLTDPGGGGGDRRMPDSGMTLPVDGQISRAQDGPTSIIAGTPGATESTRHEGEGQNGIVHDIPEGRDTVLALHTFSPSTADVEAARARGQLPPLTVTQGDELQIVQPAELRQLLKQVPTPMPPASSSAKSNYLLFGAVSVVLPWLARVFCLLAVCFFLQSRLLGNN